MPSEGGVVVCGACGRNLGAGGMAADPVTGRLERLFDPRTDVWSEHFMRAGREIRGRTGTGRATCRLLFHEPMSEVDLAWDKIRSIPPEEGLYSHLNHLRALRLKNRFDELGTEIKTPLEELGARPDHLELGIFARHLLFLETCFTRSKPEDVVRGITLAEHLAKEHRLDPARLRHLFYILSILYQQKATLCFLGSSAGDPSRLQATALRYDQRSRERFVKSPLTTTLGAALRTRTVAHRYAACEIEEARILKWQEKILDSDRIQATNDFRYLLDIVFGAGQLQWRVTEKLYEKANTLIELGGYGSEHNFALCVNLRRRWWILHLMHEDSPDLDLLQHDLRLWSDVNMGNEVRELLALILKSRGKISDGHWRDAFELARAWADPGRI